MSLFRLIIYTTLSWILLNTITFIYVSTFFVLAVNKFWLLTVWDSDMKAISNDGVGV